MNTTEDLITTECPAVAPQPINKVIKPIKFPAQPQEWKIVSLRDPTPSDADIKITRDLIRAGQLLKIEVLDHIVMGHPSHVSLRNLGYFYS